MANLINNNPLGADSIKGGIFFGSNLTPNGTFPNVPSFYTPAQITQQEPALMLTLQKVKESLATQVSLETGATTVDDVTVSQFLTTFINLLVDYRDIRNFVFYGSANTEIAYNIQYIINNYPYQTLVGQKFGSNFINIVQHIDTQTTDIIFPEVYSDSNGKIGRVILDNFNNFSFYDDDASINWQNYDVVDANARRYPILNVITPYMSQNIFKVQGFSQTSALDNNGNPYDTISVQAAGHTYQVGQIIEFEDLQCVDTSLQMQVSIASGGASYSYNINDYEFVITSVSTNSFTIRRNNVLSIYEDLDLVSNTYDNTNPGIVRYYPLQANTRPFGIKVTVQGNFVQEALLDFSYQSSNDITTVSYNGFVISPKQSIIDDWNYNLTPAQNLILSPASINPTPWPRRLVTGNIQNITSGSDMEYEFVTWLTNPAALYIADGGFDDDISYSADITYEYNLVRAMALDETYSNQLIRRVVPADMINESNDTPDFYFRRFIMIAGWFFDRLRTYIQFIKYTHSINTTSFNQLSPEYYKYYADHYGFTLFDDDSIDFSQLVIQTQPGYYYVQNNSPATSQYYQLTLQQLQYERQKRLLLSLFYLYKIKGTQACIQKLVSLLGAPDGLLSLNEYKFSVSNTNAVGYPTSGYAGVRVVDNDKINIPNVSFEIDPDYLIDKTNIKNPINQPYVYRMLLDNEYDYNLREIEINTDPNGAIDNQINTIYGSQLYNYIKFAAGEFGTLQKNTVGLGLDGFYFLPISLPDRFYGFTLEYMIPSDGFKNGVGSNQEECNVNIFSLYNIAKTNLNAQFTITGITLNGNSSQATVQVSSSTPTGYSVGDVVYIAGVSNSSGMSGINNNLFTIQTIVDAYTFVINGNFGGQYSSGGYVISGTLDIMTSGEDMLYTYPVATNYEDRNKIGDTSFALDSFGNVVVDGYTNPATDFNILQQKYPSSTYLDDNSYIITRLEGNDLVVRLRIQSEIDGVYGERCALFDNVFFADGLNHELRLMLREEGVEVYKDYLFVGLAKWINISYAGAYNAYEIPKSEIRSLRNAADSCAGDYYEPILNSDFVALPAVFNTGLDRINYWDLFIGLPENVDFYFKKLNFWENTTADDYNIADKMISTDNSTAEFYLFEVVNPVVNGTDTVEESDFTVDCVFFEKYPNTMPEYYGYVLPQEEDQYNRTIVSNLSLSNLSLYGQQSNDLYINQQEEFFNNADVFEYNAWQKDLHSAYFYDKFNGELINLYSIYSPQVLTYSSLSEFLSLIENKFQGIIEQFVPMVVNISDYGRLIQNSMFKQAKNRIPGSNRVCVGAYVSNDCFLTSYIFRTDINVENGPVEGSDFYYYIISGGNQYVLPDTNVSWDVDKALTLNDMVTSINQAGNHFISASYYLGQLRLSINYNWLQSNFSGDPNECKLYIVQNGKAYSFELGYGNLILDDAHPQVTNECGEIVSYAYTDRDACGSVQYKLASVPDDSVFIYYSTENKPPTYINYSTEAGGDYVYIKKSTE